MRSRLKDQFDDRAAVAAPIRRASARIRSIVQPAIAPMAGRHVLGDGGVLMVAAGAMCGDPLALEENLDGPHRQPQRRPRRGRSDVGLTRSTAATSTMIVDADAAFPPLRRNSYGSAGVVDVSAGRSTSSSQLPARSSRAGGSGGVH